MKKVFLIIISSILLFTAIPITSAKNFNDLTSYQKQKYWMFIKECSPYLVAKEYSKYKTCALNALEKAFQEKENNAWCTDSDSGKDFFTKGVVKTDLYPNGKEDYIYTSPAGAVYLMEGFCSSKNQYAYAQKKCSDFGKKYYAKEGACVYENKPPILADIGDKEVNEGELLSFSVSASDPDNDNLIFSAEDLPEGATFENKVFSWTPSYVQAGEYNVKFIVSDGEKDDSATVQITVKKTEEIECNPALVVGIFGEKITSFLQTNDGGCVFAGYTGSITGFDAEGWVLKIDSSGELQWIYNFQGGFQCGDGLGTVSVWPESIKQTDDGGYIVTAEGLEPCGPSGCCTGTWDFKLDKNGSLLWGG